MNRFRLRRALLARYQEVFGRCAKFRSDGLRKTRSIRVAWLAVGCSVLVSCGSQLEVETVKAECIDAVCAFEGELVASEMVGARAEQAGVWHGWLASVRSAIRTEGLADWDACDGQVTTATFSGAPSVDEGIPPLVFTVARWQDGSVRCLGTLTVPGVAFPPLEGSLPRPGDSFAYPLPESGATFELR